MDDLKRLLKQSIVEYALVSACLDSMQGNLTGMQPEQLVKSVDELHQLQEQAKKTDSLLQRNLAGLAKVDEVRDLIQRRSAMMAQILEKNRLIFDQTSGILAVKAAEMGELRSGQTAMAGYKSKVDRSGKVLRNSF